MVKLKDIYWLAGILDGEGYFNFNIKSPVIVVKMTDEDIIARVAELWKSNYKIVKSTSSNRKTAYLTQINGNKAIGWMMTLYSLMGIRRKDKIKSIIQDWKDKHVGRGGIRLTNLICKLGHLVTGNNVYTGHGIRECRICRKLSSKNYHETSMQNMRMFGIKTV